MINRVAIRQYLGNKIYNRAFGYYESGMILDLRVTPTSNKGRISVAATVRGSGSNVYSVRVMLDSDGDLIRSRCDCPYYDSCKHEGAVLLEIAESMSDYFDGDFTLEPSVDIKEDVVYAINPKPLAEEDIAQMLQLQEVDLGVPVPGSYQTIFQLSYKSFGFSAQLVVSLKRRYLKKNGEWGAISDCSLNRSNPTYSKVGEELLNHLNFCRNHTEAFINLAEIILKNREDIIMVTADDKYLKIKEADSLTLSMPDFRFASDDSVEFLPVIQCHDGENRSNNIGKGYILSKLGKLFAYDEKGATLYYVEKQAEMLPFLVNLFEEQSYFSSDVASAILEYASRYQPFLKIKPLLDKISVRYFTPTPVIFLKRGYSSIIAEIMFLYETSFVSSNEREELLRLDSEPNQLNFVGRDVKSEYQFIIKFNDVVNELSTLALEYDDFYIRSSRSSEKRLFSGTVRDFLLEIGRPLMDAGFKLTVDPTGKKMVSRTSKVEFRVKSGIDWFDLEAYRKKREEEKKSGAVNGEQSEADVADDEEMIKLTPELLRDGMFEQNGELHFLDSEAIEQLSELTDGILQKDGSIRVSRFQFTLIDLLFKMVEKRDSKLADAAELGAKLLKLSKLPRVNLPKTLKAKLRPYQKSGFYWMSLLTDNEIGGCLADDMGLGKTIQTIALIQHLREAGIEGSMLIIVPVSTLFNWEAEFDKFAPSAKYMVHRGVDRVKEVEFLASQQIILTSYATLRNDIKIFEQIEFALLVLDEAQAIKNTTSQIFKAVKTLHSKRRLTLTGTPIENSTLELWSQMNFLNPGLLGSKKAFQRKFVKPIEKEENAEVAAHLQKIVYPFILRRKKDKIAKDLPAKEEVILYVEMGGEQRKNYEKVRLEYQKKIAGEMKKDGKKFNLFSLVIEGMLRLRQICLFPGLVKDKWEHVKSCKLERLQELLPEISQEGHKVLLFSQFTKVLARLKKQLPYEADELSYLDGSTKNRRKAVNDFQNNPDKKLFLISLKAGGTGINLTAAGYVFIFDPWWNPAVEAQAIDRAHRIGQDKKVFAYKLIVKDSIEEKIVSLQEKKKNLADSLIGEDSASLKKMSEKEILALFE